MADLTARIDLRCPIDYTNRNRLETPAAHASENARGYVFTTIQQQSGFFRRITQQHPDHGRLLVFGGGRMPPPVGSHIDQLNIDFDEDAYHPLLVADLHTIPPALTAGPGDTLQAVFERARKDIAEPVRAMVERLEMVLSEQNIGSCLFSMTLNYLHRDVRRRLIGLCIAGLQKNGRVYIGDRHPFAFPENMGLSLGFQEAKETAAQWGNAVKIQEYYRAPELPKAMRQRIATTNNNFEAMVEIAKDANFIHLPYEPVYDRAPLLAHNDPNKAKKDIGMGLCLGHHVLEITKNV